MFNKFSTQGGVGTSLSTLQFCYTVQSFLCPCPCSTATSRRLSSFLGHLLGDEGLGQWGPVPQPFRLMTDGQQLEGREEMPLHGAALSFWMVAGQGSISSQGDRVLSRAQCMPAEWSLIHRRGSRLRGYMTLQRGAGPQPQECLIQRERTLACCKIAALGPHRPQDCRQGCGLHLGTRKVGDMELGVSTLPLLLDFR